MTNRETVFGFGAWLTTRDESLTVGSMHECAVVAELADEYCQANGFDEDENPIAAARKTVWEAFKRDPGFRHGYEANIAMMIKDAHHGAQPDLNLKTYEGCNELANRIIDRVFG